MITDLERALNEKRAPWTEIEFRTNNFWVFREEKFDNIMDCYKAAYKFGAEGLVTEKWDGFNVGQNCGESAGQTVMYPHIHMIPRRNGDMEDPRGGVRHVIPEKGNYKK